jgi:hypothetical protein
MLFAGEVVKPSGRGRTATWEGMAGAVTRVEGKSVFVQWHNVAVEDQLDFEEVFSTGRFQKRVPHHAVVLDGSDDEDEEEDDGSADDGEDDGADEDGDGSDDEDDDDEDDEESS